MSPFFGIGIFTVFLLFTISTNKNSLTYNEQEFIKKIQDSITVDIENTESIKDSTFNYTTDTI
jgi:hypothetical protein